MKKIPAKAKVSKLCKGFVILICYEFSNIGSDDVNQFVRPCVVLFHQCFTSSNCVYDDIHYKTGTKPILRSKGVIDPI